MADYLPSAKADEDLTGIYRFSYERFGKAKADAYLLALEERFLFLAENPKLGHNMDIIRKGYFRYEHVSHSIFYTRKNSNTILIVRVLHSGMDAQKHL